MKEKNKYFGFLLLLIISIVFIKLNYQNFSTERENKPKEYIRVEIKNGMSLKDIEKVLVDSSIINNPNLFKFFVKVYNADKKMKAGIYLLEKNQNEYDAFYKIYKGKVLQKKVVIPEGFTLKQIYKRLKEEFKIDSTEFFSTCFSKEILKKYNIKGKNCEGFLLPETYYFTDDMGARDMVLKMLELFEEKYPESLFKTNEFSFTRYEYIILASIIEKEAKVDQEKYLISGVYYNRLKKGMNLQCCATVFYALGKDGGKLLYRDLEVNSPYNTYKNTGLPPTPICSPGSVSVDAALNPTKHDFLFYVSNGDGTHTFTKTYNEHIKAQRKNRN
ncbi:MAG: endolytic transglycosylase MltG [candidate division WOR-3 bacterium]